MCKNAYGRLFSLFKAIRSNDFFQMYKIYVRPILEFGTTIAYPHFKKEIDKIEKVQITAVNIIYYRSLQYKYPIKPSYHELLFLLKDVTLEIRRNINDLVLYHKIKHRLVKVDEKCSPQFRSPLSIRGTDGAPYIPFCKTNIRFYFFLNRAGRIFAKIPPKIANDPNPAAFKSYLINSNFFKNDTR